MLRWGIIGAGRIAGKAVAPAMRAVGHDIAVVGSRSLTRAQGFASSQGARRARGSYEAVLEADDVDAVYIALPNDLHEFWTIAALRAGKHVLCEKPLGLDADAVGRMAAAAVRADRRLAEAAMWRYHPRTDAALSLIAGGAIGTVQLVHASFSFGLHDLDDIRARPERGGGALLDVGFYSVTAARWLAGEEPDAVTAQSSLLPTGVDGVTVATLRFPGGALATLAACMTAARQETVEVVGSEGILRLERAYTAGADADAVLFHNGAPAGAWRADPYESMLRAFDEAAAGGAGVLGTTDALATVTVLDRIRASARSRPTGA